MPAGPSTSEAMVTCIIAAEQQQQYSVVILDLMGRILQLGNNACASMILANFQVKLN